MITVELRDQTYNPGAATYVIPFVINASTEIKVIHILASTGTRTVLVKDIDYTVNVDLNEITIIVPGAWGAGALRIIGDDKFLQQVDLTEAGPFLAEAVESGLDRLTKLMQQTLARSVKEDLTTGKISGRVVSYPPADYALDGQLPVKSARVGKWARFADVTGILEPTDTLPANQAFSSSTIRALLYPQSGHEQTKGVVPFDYQPYGRSDRYTNLNDGVLACKNTKDKLSLIDAIHSIVATMVVDEPLVIEGIGVNTGLSKGSIIENITNDIIAIDVSSTGNVQRTDLSDFGIIHRAATKPAIRFFDGAAYGKMEDIVIGCGGVGHSGFEYGDHAASSIAEAWQGVLDNIRVDDAVAYCGRYNTTGHTTEWRNLSLRTNVAGAHGAYINSRNCNIIGGQFSAGAGGVPIYFHNIDSQAHHRGSVKETVFEGVPVNEYAIVIDGTAFGFNKVIVERVGIQLSTSLGTLIKFGRSSDSELRLPSVLSPTGGGKLAEWGEFSVDCRIIVDADGARAPVVVHASATRALKVVIGRIPIANVAGITTAANLTTILQDGIVELPGVRPIHNGVSWNYVPVTPAQIVANTDNYAPTGLGHNLTFRLSSDAARNLTGIVAQTGGTRMMLQNIGAQNIVLMHDVTSTAANRFFCPGSANYTLNANDAVEIEYDSTSSRWRVLAAA